MTPHQRRCGRVRWKSAAKWTSVRGEGLRDMPDRRTERHALVKPLLSARRFYALGDMLETAIDSVCCETRGSP